MLHFSPSWNIKDHVPKSPNFILPVFSRAAKSTDVFGATDNVVISPNPADCEPMDLTMSSNSDGSSRVHYENPDLALLVKLAKNANEVALTNLKKVESCGHEENGREMVDNGKRVIESQQCLNQTVPLLQSLVNAEVEEESESSEHDESPVVNQSNAVVANQQSDLVRTKSKFASAVDESEPDWMRSFDRPATIENNASKTHVPSNVYPPNSKEAMRYELIAMFREQENNSTPQNFEVQSVDTVQSNPQNGLVANGLIMGLPPGLNHNVMAWNGNHLADMQLFPSPSARPVQENPLVKRRAKMTKTPVIHNQGYNIAN